MKMLHLFLTSGSYKESVFFLVEVKAQRSCLEPRRFCIGFTRGFCVGAWGRKTEYSTGSAWQNLHSRWRFGDALNVYIKNLAKIWFCHSQDLNCQSTMFSNWENYCVQKMIARKKPRFFQENGIHHHFRTKHNGPLQDWLWWCIENLAEFARKWNKGSGDYFSLELRLLILNFYYNKWYFIAHYNEKVVNSFTTNSILLRAPTEV